MFSFSLSNHSLLKKVIWHPAAHQFIQISLPILPS